MVLITKHRNELQVTELTTSPRVNKLQVTALITSHRVNELQVTVSLLNIE